MGINRPRCPAYCIDRSPASRVVVHGDTAPKYSPKYAPSFWGQDKAKSKAPASDSYYSAPAPAPSYSSSSVGDTSGYSQDQLDFLRRTGKLDQLAPVSPSYGGGYSEEQLAFMRRKEAEKR